MPSESAQLPESLQDPLSRYNKPDESAEIRGQADAGMKGKWDNWYQHPEDVPESADIPIQERLAGGGSTALDELFDPTMGEASQDPELLMQLREFLEEEYGVSRLEDLALYVPEDHGLQSNADFDIMARAREDFVAYMNEAEGVVSSIAPEELALNEIQEYGAEVAFDPNDPELGFDYFALRDLWSNPDTKATYEIGQSFGGDHLVLERTNEAGESVEVEFPVPQMIGALKAGKQQYQSEAKSRGVRHPSYRYPMIPRPTDVIKQAALERAMGTLVLEGEIFKPEHIEVAPRRSKVRVSEHDLDFIRTPEMRTSMQSWLDTWEDSSIESKELGLVVRGDRVSRITISGERGDSAIAVDVPFGVFRVSVGGDRWYRGANGTREEGARLPGSGELVMPSSSQQDLEHAFQNLEINGVIHRDLAVSVEVAN